MSKRERKGGKLERERVFLLCCFDRSIVFIIQFNGIRIQLQLRASKGQLKPFLFLSRSRSLFRLAKNCEHSSCDPIEIHRALSEFRIEDCSFRFGSLMKAPFSSGFASRVLIEFPRFELEILVLGF